MKNFRYTEEFKDQDDELPSIYKVDSTTNILHIYSHSEFVHTCTHTLLWLKHLEVVAYLMKFSSHILASKKKESPLNKHNNIINLDKLNANVIM